jgi:hypothetical protein
MPGRLAFAYRGAGNLAEGQRLITIAGTSGTTGTPGTEGPPVHR